MIGSGRWSTSGRPQCLQIGEICDAAREFLDSKRIVGLEQSYLPTGLRVQVAAGDFASLRPFETELRQALQVIVEGLGRRPGFFVSPSPLVLELISEPGRAEGASPCLTAGYPPGEQEAHWMAPRGEDAPNAAMPSLELVFTSIAAGRTGVQERYGLILDPGPVEAQGGEEQRVVVGNPFARSPVPGARCPSALDQPELAARLIRSSGSYPQSIWPDDGALLIGRDEDSAHVAPADAPPTMSRKHCALIEGRDGDLHVIDLGSGNGTSVCGSRCSPFEPVRLALPAVLEIGRSNHFQVEVLRI